MPTRKIVVVAVCFLLAMLTITVRFAAATPVIQESEPVKPSQPDTGEPVVVNNITEVFTGAEGIPLPVKPVANIMTQDFEGTWPATGWQMMAVGSNNGGNYRWGKRTCHPHSGSMAAGLVGGDAEGSGSNCTAIYPDSAYTWIIYGPFDLRGATGASLTYYLWGQTEGGSGCPRDYFFAGSSTDGLQFNGSRYCGNWTAGSGENGYTRHTLDLASRSGQSQVLVGFLLRSDSSNGYNGLTVDDVTLDATGGPPTALAPPTPTNMTTWASMSHAATEMLVNGNFEQYHTGWTETTGAGVPVIQPPPSGITAHSGRYLAWLGGYHNADDQLFQNVTIPTNLSSGVLSFWYWSQSSDTAAGRDYFTLQLLNPATGSHYADAFLIDAAPPSNGWRFASYALTGNQISAIRGQTVRVRFRVVTNDTRLSSFFVDDVSFQVNGPVTPTTVEPTFTYTYTPTPAGPTPTFTSTAPHPATATWTPTRPAIPASAVKLPMVSKDFPPPTPTPTPTPTPAPPHWQWQHGQHPVYGLHFVDATTGWAVGEWGLIIRTNDGGQTWAIQESRITNDLNAVQFVNANEGWVIGDAGTILHTSNGGATWSAQSSPYAVDLNVMWFVDSQHGWIGLPDGVLKTTDGGATWFKTGAGIPAMVNDIQFFDSNNGVLVTLSAFAGRGVVKITSDGGETWRTTACTAPWPEHCDRVWALHFPTPQFGIAVGGFVNSYQYVSTDGGASWTSRGPSIQFKEPNEVYFADVSNGWAVQGSTYLRTSDGGQTWSQFSGPSANDIQLLAPNLGFVAGYYDVSKTTDGGYTFSRSNKFDQSSLTGVSFADANAGWAVSNGRIWHTVNGGQQWDSQLSNTSGLNSIESVSPQRAWTVGFGGRILATSNGGTTWSAQTASTTYNLLDVDFVDNSYGWIVGEENTNYNPNGRVWRTTDSGTHWTQAGYFSGYQQGGHGKYGVDFVSRTTGYIVGQEVLSGSVHKTTDGGNTWTAKLLGDEYPEINAVDFVDLNMGWVVGETGFIAHTTNGGNSWEVQVSGVSSSLTDVKFLSSQTGYAVGGSVVLQTTDGGLTWTRVITGPYAEIVGVDFVDPSHGWIVGGYGLIRSYQ